VGRLQSADPGLEVVHPHAKIGYSGLGKNTLDRRRTDVYFSMGTVLRRCVNVVRGLKARCSQSRVRGTPVTVNSSPFLLIARTVTECFPEPNLQRSLKFPAGLFEVGSSVCGRHVRPELKSLSFDDRFSVNQ
jgi:hypothetical protein